MNKRCRYTQQRTKLGVKSLTIKGSKCVVNAKGEGVTMSMSSEFENELDENKVQVTRIRDKNVNFVLCHFHRSVLYLHRECF